jgi:phosphate transport system substrate-binding protein
MMQKQLAIALCGVVMISFCLAARAQSSDRIVIDGSTGVTPLVAALAKAYQARNKAVTIDIGKGLGTRARIDALNAGKIDIAMASHGLDVAQIEKQGMVVHEIAKVAVVFGVNASVPLNEITEARVCDIYAGKIAHWKELAGSDLSLVAMTRPDSEVDTEVVREKIACLAKLQMPDAVKVMPKTAEMAQALASTTGAIGVTTMTVVEQSKGQIKALSLQGVAPTAENVQRGAYKLTRDSFLVVKAPPSPAVSAFLDFIRSTTGAGIIAANGAIAAARQP